MPYTSPTLRRSGLRGGCRWFSCLLSRRRSHPEKAGARIIFLPSTDVRATEAEGQMRDEWGVCHISCARMKFGEEGGLVLAGGFDSAL